MNATLQQIEREFRKEHTLSEKKINILFAFLRAQADRIETLEIEKGALVIKVRADNAAFDAEAK
jgi:hypothetical protein